ANFIASFVRDLLRNQAWEHWYYDDFAELRGLPVGQAIARALCDDGDAGRDALLEIDRAGELDLLLDAMSDAEVDRVATTCSLPAAPLGPSSFAWIHPTGDLLKRGDIDPRGPRGFVRLYMGILKHRPELGPDVNLAHFLRELVERRENMADL